MGLMYETDSGEMGQVHVGSGGSMQGKGVILLQACGHELEKIRRDFSGIPMYRGRVVRWHGDIAKFIAENWGV